MTLHLNKKHVLFQVERSEEVLKTAFSVTTKATRPPELKKTFLERTQRRFGKFVWLKKQQLFLSVFDITKHLKRMMKIAKVPIVAFENWRSRNVTLHLNKKHVLFQVERSEEVLKTDFLVTTKEKSQAEVKMAILERTHRCFGKFVFSFW